MSYNTDTFASIEIRNTTFNLVVGFFADNQVNVIFSHVYKLTNNCLDGEIKDHDSLVNDLKSILNVTNPLTNIPIVINETILTYVPYGLEVYNSKRDTTVIGDNNVISKVDINNVIKLVKKDELPNANNKIVDIIPCSFITQDGAEFQEPPLGVTSNNLYLNADIYTLPIKLVDELKSCFLEAGIKVAKEVIDPLGVAFYFEKILKIDMKSYIYFDGGYQNTNSNLVVRTKLIKSTYFQFGYEELIKSISSALLIDEETSLGLLKKYGYNERQTAFKFPILESTNEEGIKVSHFQDELNSLIDNYVKKYCLYLDNSVDYLIGKEHNSRNLVTYIINSKISEIVGINKVFERYLKNNFIINQTNCIGANDVSLFGCLASIAYAANYKGSLMDIDFNKEVNELNRVVKE